MTSPTLTLFLFQLATLSTRRAPGFEAAILAAATHRESDRVTLSRDDFQRINRDFLSLPAAAPKAKFGLGDAVAILAQPIAGVLDAVTGSHLKECGGCKARREALNKAVPNVFGPF